MTKLLLCGLPGLGKTTFGRFLSEKYKFAHYDLEVVPGGWPQPKLIEPLWNPIFNNDPNIMKLNVKKFIKELSKIHEKFVLDWGFPPAYLSVVEQLKKNGVHLIWLHSSVEEARNLFSKREQENASKMIAFNNQIEKIKTSGLPTKEFIVIDALDSGGNPRDGEDIFQELSAITKL